MGWFIDEVENTVTFTKTQAEQLISDGWKLTDHIYEAEEAKEEFFGWGEIEEIGNILYFNMDHMEHMDYLTWNDDLCKLIASMKVEGDVCFASEEGDNAGESWGVRFDGQGGYKVLIGSRQFEEIG